MPEAPNITLDGVPVLSIGNVGWQLRDGVNPVVQQMPIAASATRSLRTAMRTGRDVSLKFEIPGRRSVTVEKLSILRIDPGPNQHIESVVVADRRWKWAYSHVLRRYNIRRNIGFKKIDNLASENLDTIGPDVWYARYSVRDSGKIRLSQDDAWDAKQVVVDVLNAVDPGALLPDTFPQDARLLPIEDLEIDGPGDSQISRVLQYVNGLGIYVGFDGRVRLFDKADGGEVREINRIGFVKGEPVEIENTGHMKFSDNSAMRPKKIRVLFTIEGELRFDFEETDDGRGDTTTGDPKFARRVDNVIQVPDFNLVLASGTNVSQGTWIPLLDCINSKGWQDTPDTATIQNVTIKTLRQAIIPDNGLWGALGVLGILDPDDDWPSRIGALHDSFRKLFRIRQGWMDNILSIRPYLVATVDPEGGTRAPALAFSDYFVKTTMRSMIKNRALGKFYGFNVQGAPVGTLSPNVRSSSALVHIRDADQGILSLEYVRDSNNLAQSIIPGNLDARTAPSGNFEECGGGACNPVAFNAVAENNRIPEMKPNHRVAVLVSAVPASPNDKRQLYAVEISANDPAMKQLLPEAAQKGLDEAFGPVKEIRVQPSIETARVRWLDSRSTDIEKAWGVRQSDPDDTNEKLLAGLVMNDAEQQALGTTAASLKAIARAIAAQQYASYANRWEGSAEVDWNPNLKPAGNLETVDFAVDPAGEATARLQLPPRPEPFDLFALLPASTRQVILKQAQPSAVV